MLSCVNSKNSLCHCGEIFFCRIEEKKNQISIYIGPLVILLINSVLKLIQLHLRYGTIRLFTLVGILLFFQMSAVTAIIYQLCHPFLLAINSTIWSFVICAHMRIVHSLVAHTMHHNLYIIFSVFQCH